MKAMFRHHPVLTTAFLLAVAATLFFSVRFTTQLIYWQIHENEPIRPWMTVGYIGRSWDLNPRVIDETAGLPKPVNGRPFTLAEIASQRGVPVENVIGDVEAAIARLEAEKHKGGKP